MGHSEALRIDVDQKDVEFIDQATGDLSTGLACSRYYKIGFHSKTLMEPSTNPKSILLGKAKATPRNSKSRFVKMPLEIDGLSDRPAPFGESKSEGTLAAGSGFIHNFQFALVEYDLGRSFAG